MAYSKIYRKEAGAWHNMKRRCFDKKDISYHRYGGRGITVCQRWHTFANFFEDMGHAPSPEHSLDRINCNGNYEPGNCKWSTKKEQDRNRRSNRTLTLNGETLCISAWAERLGVPKGTISSRIRFGFPVEKILNVADIRQSPISQDVRDEILRLFKDGIKRSEIHKILNINPHIVYKAVAAWKRKQANLPSLS